MTCPCCEPYPPLTSHGLEAAALRVAILRPHRLRELRGHHFTWLPFAAILRAAKLVHARGDRVELRTIAGVIAGITWDQFVDAWCEYDLDDPSRVKASAIRELRRMSWWRHRYDECLRAAIACEHGDLADAHALIQRIYSRLDQARHDAKAVA